MYSCRAVALLLLCFPVCFAAARADELQYPVSVAAAPDGTLYLADRDLPGIWQWKDGALSVYYKGQKQFRTPLNAVRCVAVDAEGHVLAGDSATREVYRFDADGKPHALTDGAIGIPMDLAVNQAGEIYVSDLEARRVVKVAAKGGEPETVLSLPGCRGLFVDAEDHLWAIATRVDQLRRLSPEGQSEMVVPGRVFQFPHTVVVDEQGTAYVADGYAKAVWKVPPGEAPTRWVSGAPFVNPVGLAWRQENLVVVDPRAKAVFQVDPQGKVTRLIP